MIAAVPFRSTSYRTFKKIALRDHVFEMPLDHHQADSPRIEVFAREVVGSKRVHDDLPWMIFFQGGPGFPANRPMNEGGWIGEVLKTHRLLLLDQRGTGLSTRVLPQTLARFATAQEQADYLTHFRADAIVRDAECIRHSLLEPGQKWKGIGQSYGGFCLLTYLSFHPEGLDGVIITGGVPGIQGGAEANYRHTYVKVREKNEAYYRHYPEDDARVREIVAHLLDHEVTLPSGGTLSPRRFQALGLLLGMDGGFEQLHYLLEKAWVDGSSGRELALDFLMAVEAAHAFDSNPIFCILHESIYAEGEATDWTAERLRAEFPEFEIRRSERLLFTGEMIAPGMLDDFVALRPLKACAEILAARSDWGPLYDRKQLASNKVPTAAISYFEDMYVPIEKSRETALAIPNFYQWVSNEWEHNGIGTEGPKIVSTLLERLESPRL
ncbi:pimeloyl-ACP methyl ester carboxylesterase [Haloferula luteola]|uniref:Pimeloyl-ACP methyl ester carboxylesterase n=1 Tax=Haloferula luteola TaxID=595692 RepID=A0A840VIC7_9BACT|nr:alpha/beta fold hydrolase [Haloferula luteola]MBB5353539.1 pimeloyl-ACP methyl ester carboxylesterase [Haloferula luteola]